MKKNGRDQIELIGVTGEPSYVDRFGAQMTVSQFHAHIQNGEAYSVLESITADDELTSASGQKKEWLFRTNNTKEHHWNYSFQSDWPGVLDFYMDHPSFPMDITSDGTGIFVNNLDLNKSVTAPPTGIAMYKDPTIVDPGYKIISRMIGDKHASRGGAGGTIEANIKYILNHNMTYLVRFTPYIDAAAYDVYLNFLQYFYEVDKA